MIRQTKNSKQSNKYAWSGWGGGPPMGTKSSPDDKIIPLAEVMREHFKTYNTDEFLKKVRSRNIPLPLVPINEDYYHKGMDRAYSLV
jgi:hypothetical protein